MSGFGKPGRLARRVFLCAVFAAPVVPLIAMANESGEVGIDNFKFSPTPLTIAKGTAVTWTNHDDIPHSIVLNSLAVRSKVMDTGAAFTYRFDQSGTYAYICGLHPFMQARVVVK